jgi:hypothetical protein
MCGFVAEGNFFERYILTQRWRRARTRPIDDRFVALQYVAHS